MGEQRKCVYYGKVSKELPRVGSIGGIPSYTLKKSLLLGLEIWLSGEECLLLFRKTWVWFLAHDNSAFDKFLPNLAKVT